MIRIILFVFSYHLFAAEAYIAGGCFWCMEPPFEKLEGVFEVVSGYAGGTKENPTYKEVSAGKTKHTEAVKIVYDPNKITYKQLIDLFWKNIDPTDNEGQFVDRGKQYRPVIFYQTKEEKKQAKKSKQELIAKKIFKQPIVVPIKKLKKFYPAEDYHQDYYKKNPVRYKYYRYGSGRDRFLKKYWNKD